MQMYYLWFISLYTYYVFVISCKYDDKLNLNIYLRKVKLLCFIGFIFSSLLVSYLPMEYYNNGKYVYSYGLSVNCLSLILLVVMIVWAIIIAKNYKVINFLLLVRVK